MPSQHQLPAPTAVETGSTSRPSPDDAAQAQHEPDTDADACSGHRARARQPSGRTGMDITWVSTQRAAQRLGIGPRTLYRLIDVGDVPAYKFGRVIRLQLAEVDAYIERARIQPGGPRASVPRVRSTAQHGPTRSETASFSLT